MYLWRCQFIVLAVTVIIIFYQKRLEVSDIISFDKGISESELLSLTASAEGKSEHPLGKAIVAHAKEKGIVLKDWKNCVFREKPPLLLLMAIPV